MNNILIFLLIAIALVMIFLGIKASMIPPGLTGVGFLLIAAILFKKG
jgi:hypothetical protein